MPESRTIAATRFSLSPGETIQIGQLPDRPLVSILMSSFNYASYLPDAIDSVKRQTWQNFELIICDDGSSDASPEIIRAAAKDDPRIAPLFRENGGQAAAWNTAFANCRGDVVCLLDPDDLFMPEKLERVIDAFRASPLTGLSYHRYLPVDTGLTPVDEPMPLLMPQGNLYEEALRNAGAAFPWKSSELSLRREYAEIVFPLPGDFCNTADGRIAALAQFITHVSAIPDVLSLYRIHDTNEIASAANTTVSEERILDAIEDCVMTLRNQLRQIGLDRVAEQLNLEDNEYYWRRMGTLYVLSGRPVDGVRGHSSERITSRLLRGRHRLIWQVILSSPDPVARRLITAWAGQGSWKRAPRRLARFLMPERRTKETATFGSVAE